MLECQNHAWCSSQQPAWMSLSSDCTWTAQVKCWHCLPGEGSLQEHSPGYTLFWLGKPTIEGHLSGISFMVNTSIASWLENLPTGHSDCVMFMRLPMKNKRYGMLFIVYAATLQAEPAEKACKLSPKHPCRWKGDNPWWFQCLSGPRCRFLERSTWQTQRW